ncbi:1-phosphofructokinase family hexose kinase [Pseudaestuariivita rosea]|uniref:1-phosphofructokinase family hexose kinase n=1 Tax=Pseudaestuariivita rosea TaxID=2763263 RepID=UPI001ABA651D|nr:1-phosphofructokinase family hexose kinase [Pseudaestuariivita rosea]
MSIFTITLNPAVDLSTSVAGVKPGPKLRCGVPQIDPGGGGINVSRAISILGGESRALIAVGGTTGAQLRSLLQAESIDHIPFDVTGETRQSLSVHDDLTGDQYRFIMPGPGWDQQLVDRFLDQIHENAAPGDIVVLSGSAPPGVPVDFPAQLAHALAPTNSRLFVDTSGPALLHLFQSSGNGVDLIRIDMAEAAEVAGRVLPDVRASADYAQQCVQAGVANVIVLARGAEGSVLATQDQRLFCNAADVPVKSKTGAGDSFLAGLTLALSRGEEYATALKWGATAASAAVMTDATSLCRKEDFDRLLSDCVVREV